MRLLCGEIFNLKNTFYTKKHYKICNDVVYLNGKYIIASNYGEILITSNCSDYSRVKLVNSNEEFIKIIVFNNKCVAIGKSGIVAIIDCNDFDNNEFSRLDATRLYDITTDGTKVVISGNDCKAFVSVDLVNWETKQINKNVSGSMQLGYWEHILFDGSQFVVGRYVSDMSSGRYYIKKSTDLETWDDVIRWDNSGVIYKINYFDGKYFLFKNTGYRYIADLTHLNDNYNLVFTSGIPQKCVCFDNKLYIICSNTIYGSNAYSNQSNIDVVDLDNLTLITKTVNAGEYRARSICINNEKIVCCGDDMPYDSLSGYVSYKYNAD